MKGFLGSLLGSLLIFAPLALAADASSQVVFGFTGSDFLIPRPEAVAPVGEPRLLVTYEVAESMVGKTCSFNVTAANGESVHQANYGRLVTNGDQTDILGTEDEPFVTATRLTDSQLTLGDTIQLFNIIGPHTDGDNLRDGYVGTSVDYGVTATCQSTTTTTTSTTVIPSTTTSQSSSSTTTTSPTTDTSFPPPTTSTLPPAPPTTAPTESTTTTVPPVTSPPTLPFTGPSQRTVGIGMAAAAMVLLGAGVLATLREVEK